MNKKGILLVSVGTSQVDALTKTTFQLQKEVEEQFKDAKCYVAFSSQYILKKMNENSDVHYIGIAEAFEQMYADGITDLIVQSTNLLNGLESDSMLEQIEANKARFAGMKIGRPLFHEKEDYIQTVQILLEAASLEDDEALVLIGHGTNHLSNSAYQNLEYTAYTQGNRNVFVGTMEGSEEGGVTKSHRMTLRKLSVSGFKKVRLMPLLFVAGYHAKKDIAADANSWKSVLEEAGYMVEPLIVGLGEIPGIRARFMAHLKHAMEQE